jgi:hypothetical protein
MAAGCFILTSAHANRLHIFSSGREVQDAHSLPSTTTGNKKPGLLWYAQAWFLLSSLTHLQGKVWTSGH